MFGSPTMGTFIADSKASQLGLGLAKFSGMIQTSSHLVIAHSSISLKLTESGETSLGIHIQQECPKGHIEAPDLSEYSLG